MHETYIILLINVSSINSIKKKNYGWCPYRKKRDSQGGECCVKTETHREKTAI